MNLLSGLPAVYSWFCVVVQKLTCEYVVYIQDQANPFLWWETVSSQDSFQDFAARSLRGSTKKKMRPIILRWRFPTWRSTMKKSVTCWIPKGKCSVFSCAFLLDFITICSYTIYINPRWKCRLQNLVWFAQVGTQDGDRMQLVESLVPSFPTKQQRIIFWHCCILGLHGLMWVGRHTAGEGGRVFQGHLFVKLGAGERSEKPVSPDPVRDYSGVLCVLQMPFWQLLFAKMTSLCFWSVTIRH